MYYILHLKEFNFFKIIKLVFLFREKICFSHKKSWNFVLEKAHKPYMSRKSSNSIVLCLCSSNLEVWNSPVLLRNPRHKGSHYMRKSLSTHSHQFFMHTKPDAYTMRTLTYANVTCNWPKQIELLTVVFWGGFSFVFVRSFFADVQFLAQIPWVSY